MARPRVVPEPNGGDGGGDAEDAGADGSADADADGGESEDAGPRRSRATNANEDNLSSRSPVRRGLHWKYQHWTWCAKVFTEGRRRKMGGRSDQKDSSGRKAVEVQLMTK